MIAIDPEQTHSPCLKASCSDIVLLGFLIKLRRVLAVETECQMKGLLFTFRACECSIHAHKVFKLHRPLNLGYVTAEERDSKIVEIILLHHAIVGVPDILFE